MTALFAQVRAPRTPRRQRAAVRVALGLSAGALGWSGLAQAAGEEAASQVLLLPEHYERMDNGVVVFKLETGENLSLTADQYLILDDGLLLITDELAQASVYSLPVMGSVRAQLLSDLAPVATIDGTVAEATPQQTVAITQGTAPRLSEQVDLQSYELAQASDGSSSEVGEAVALGLSVSPGAMALLGMLITSDQPSEFWSDSMVPDSASTAITGSRGASYLGYTSASPTAVDWLSSVGSGAGNVATFDMSLGGNNLGMFGSDAGADGGLFKYIGGPRNDSLTFRPQLAESGNATFDMSLGGSNSLTAEEDIAEFDGFFTYIGGQGADTLSFGDDLGDGGTVVFHMELGGQNKLVAASSAAEDGTLTYYGGPNSDSLTFEDFLAYDGTATFDMSRGGKNTIIVADSAADSGTLTYYGGPGRDRLKFGNVLAEEGSATFDMSRGGTNTLIVGEDIAEDDGFFTYIGGASSDNLSFDNDLGDDGTIVFRMELGGQNNLVAASSAAEDGTLTYYGGPNSDTLTFGDFLAYGGTATFDMSLGGSNTLVVGERAAELSGGGGAGGGTAKGSIIYLGGTGSDSLTFGTRLAEDRGTVDLSLGNDTSADRVVFKGVVDELAGGNVKIQNFNPNHDTIVLEAPSATGSVTLTTAGAGVQVTTTTSTEIDFTITGVTALALTKSLNSSGDVEIG